MRIATRHILVLLAHLGFVIVYALRVNLSVALVAMVANDDITTNYTGKGNGTNYDDGKAVGFQWNRELQGLILSSFFYGYLFTNAPGGLLASRYGGKWVFGLGILWASILTLLTPIAAAYSPYLLVAIRVLIGLGQGVVFPSFFALIAKWAPPSEISRFVVFSQSGASTGTIITLPLASMLCDSQFLGGWPSAFYVFGLVGVVWFIVWINFVSDSPEDHRSISEEEKSFIRQSQSNRAVPKERGPVPWFQIFTSVHVWAIMVAHFSHNWIWFLVLTGLPSYFNSVLEFDIRKTGFLSSLPYVVGFIGYISGGITADFLIKKRLSVTITRKVIATIALFSGAGFLVLAGYSPAGDHVLPVTFMIIGIGLLCTNHAGTMTNPLDITPNFGSVLLGITQTTGTLSGCIAPLVTGYFTKTEPSRANYQKVFVIAGCVSAFGAIFYGVCGTGVQQSWNDAPNVNENVAAPILPLNGNDEDNKIREDKCRDEFI